MKFCYSARLPLRFGREAHEAGCPVKDEALDAALVSWEWLQRETDIFGTFNVQHY